MSPLSKVLRHFPKHKNPRTSEKFLNLWLEIFQDLTIFPICLLKIFMLKEIKSCEVFFHNNCGCVGVFIISYIFNFFLIAAHAKVFADRYDWCTTKTKKDMLYIGVSQEPFDATSNTLLCFCVIGLTCSFEDYICTPIGLFLNRKSCW